MRALSMQLLALAAVLKAMALHPIVKLHDAAGTDRGRLLGLEVAHWR